jgi:hypothetical protein
MSMRALPLLLLVVALAGCRATGVQYGNFLPDTPTATGDTLARDAVKQLLIVYPPARNRLDLQHDTTDAFGQVLVTTLRGKGYAVQEFQPAPAAASTALPLRYVVDQASGTDLVRVTLLVGAQSLTRAYLIRNGTTAPAGAWLRKE